VKVHFYFTMGLAGGSVWPLEWTNHNNQFYWFEWFHQTWRYTDRFANSRTHCWEVM